jgi:enamine deaminase RidA (YjgF/YER057c/UK114 family)
MAKRRSDHPAGKPLHQQPIPSVCRVGNMIFSGAISGIDRTTGELPPDAETQIANAFDNLKACVEVAGGTLGDIGKLTVFLADRDQRTIVNKHWLALFPDEHDRPARHTVGGALPGGYVIQMEFVAVV